VRRIERCRRIVFAPAVGDEEAEELAQRRKAARGAARRTPCTGELGEVSPEIVARGGFERRRPILSRSPN
jgi:hypothetical protein